MQTEARHIMGNFLREQRDRAGLSVDEVSRHMILSAEEILRIESGIQSASLGEIYAFANIYNTPTEKVMDLLLQLPDLSSALELHAQQMTKVKR